MTKSTKTKIETPPALWDLEQPDQPEPGAPSRLPVATEDHAPTEKGGRPRIKPDYDAIFKAASEVPGRADATIARECRYSLKTFRAICERDPKAQAAYEAGRAVASGELAKEFWQKAKESKNPLPMMALANQPAERGGLGFTNPTNRTEIHADMNVTIHEGVRAPGETIDAEFTEVPPGPGVE